LVLLNNEAFVELANQPNFNISQTSTSAKLQHQPNSNSGTNATLEISAPQTLLV
jgi:hypothetical protein